MIDCIETCSIEGIKNSFQFGDLFSHNFSFVLYSFCITVLFVKELMSPLDGECYKRWLAYGCK